MSLFHSTAHGFLADATVQFYALVGGTGLVEGTIYYVLAAGLTADDFAVSLTQGGAAVTFTDDITSGYASPVATYAIVADGVMDQPTALSAPTISSAVATSDLQTDGSSVSRITVTIVQPTDATLRHSVVTCTPSGGVALTAIIPLGQTHCVFDVIGGVSHDVIAKSYDTFGLASAASSTTTVTSAADTTAPAQVTGLTVLGAIRGLFVAWGASASADLSHYELDLDTADTFATATTTKVKTTSFSYTQLAYGTYYIRVRAVDLTGNAGTYSSTVSGAARLVAGGAADIEANSITANDITAGTITATELAADSVTAEKLNIQDESGTTVLTGAGFAGSWLSFLASHLVYNADFAAGDTSDIAPTEVGSGASAADYAASLTSHLPYWVVASSGGTVARVADSSASAGSALKMLVGAGQVNRVYQDVTIDSQTQGYAGYGLTVTAAAAAVPSGTVVLNAYYSYRDSTHAILGSRTLWGTTDWVNPYGYTSDLDLNAFTVSVPAGTTYLRVELEVVGDTAGQELRLDYITLIPGQIFGNSVAAASDITSLGTIFSYGEVNGNPLVAGSAIYLKWIGNDTLQLSTDGATTPIRALDGLGANLRGFGGTSFPANKATNDRFFRTDLGMEFYYDGTRWLSTELFSTIRFGNPTALAATTSAFFSGIPRLQGGSDIWLVNHRSHLIVNTGGTALGASHKWVETIWYRDVNNANQTTIITNNVNSGSSGVFRAFDTTLGSLIGATPQIYGYSWTKTGTPGTLQHFDELSYRIVAT